MAIRINRAGETIFGEYGSGDVVINLPQHQQNLLLEAGQAVLLTEEEISIVLAGAAGSGGGVGGGSGGSDRTAVTPESDPVNGGQRVLTETLDGIPHTYTYDVQGNLVVDEWVAGGLERNIDVATVPGFGIPSGNIFVGETISMLSSQMAALKAALITLGTQVTRRFFVRDFDSNRGLLLEWNHVDQCFRGIGRTAFKAGQRFAWSSGDNPGMTKLTAGTIVVPSWLRAAGGHLNIYAAGDFIGEADTKTLGIEINGNVLFTNTLSTATHNAAEMRAAVQTPTLPDLRTVSSFTGYARGTSSAAHGTTTIAAGTDLTVIATMQFISGGGTGMSSQLHEFYVEVHNP